MVDIAALYPLPHPEDYVPPFVSQHTPPEKADKDQGLNDCTWAAGLMLLATWTAGEVVTTKYGRPVTKQVGLFERRDHMRAASGRGEDDSNLGDLAMATRLLWPELEDLLPHVSGQESGTLALTYEKMWQMLEHGWCAVVQGNPKHVTDAGSPLRSAQDNDDYGHAVFVHRADPVKGAFILDPLQRPPRYRGAWVPRKDVEEFMSEYGVTPFCAIVKRGGQSRAARIREKLGPASKKAAREK